MVASCSRTDSLLSYSQCIKCIFFIIGGWLCMFALEKSVWHTGYRILSRYIIILTIYIEKMLGLFKNYLLSNEFNLILFINLLIVNKSQLKI